MVVKLVIHLEIHGMLLIGFYLLQKVVREILVKRVKPELMVLMDKMVIQVRQQDLAHLQPQ